MCTVPGRATQKHSYLVHKETECGREQNTVRHKSAKRNGENTQLLLNYPGSRFFILSLLNLYSYIIYIPNKGI